MGRHEPHPTFVETHADLYMVRHPIVHRIKIGSARNVASRMLSLQCGAACPLEILGVLRSGARFEIPLHRAYDEDRVFGEWFDEAAIGLLALATHLTQEAVEAVLELRVPKWREMVEGYAIYLDSERVKERRAMQARLDAFLADERRRKP